MERLNTVRYNQWSPDNVVLEGCGPPDGTYINADSGEILSAYHSWANNNEDGDPGHAYIKAQVTFNGEPVPVDVNTEFEYRRQVNDTTYEIMVGPGGSHTVSFAVQLDDIPGGENVSYGANVLEVTPRRLIGF